MINLKRKLCDLKCTNGGVCAADNLSCICPIGFGGKFCDAQCDLPCQNGGRCSFISNEKDEFENQIWATNDNGIFCQCPVGFAGPNCEFLAEVCGYGERVCLHGSKCSRQSPLDSFRCICPESTSNTSEAGFCQNYQTEFCTPSDGHLEYAWGMAVAAFCVNDGKCKDVVVGNQIFPSCVCPPQFTGPHCEFLVLESSADSTRMNTTATEIEPKRRGGLIILLCFVSFATLVFFLFVARQIRRLANRKDGDAINLQSFRDEDIAVSPNGSMLFPAFSPNDSFSTSNRSRSTRSRGRRFT